MFRKESVRATHPRTAVNSRGTGSSARSAPFFCARIALAACGGGVPGDPRARSPTSTARRSPRTPSTTGWRSRPRAPSSRARPPPVTVPDPPDYTQCIATKRKPRPSPAKGQPAPTDAQLKPQCQAGVQPGQQDQVMQFLITAQWIPGEAKDQDIKVTDAEVKKQFDQQKKQSFPKEADYQKFLKTSAMTPGGRPAARQARPALQARSATKVTKGKNKVTDAADHRLLQQEQVALRPARAPRPADRPDQDEGPGQRRQGRARARPELGVGRQEVLDRRRLQGARRQARRASPRASRRRRSTTPSSAPRRARSSARSRRSSATTSSRSPRSRRRASRRSPRPRRRSSRCCSPRTSRRRSTASSRTSTRSGRTRRTAARATSSTRARTRRSPRRPSHAAPRPFRSSRPPPVVSRR